MGFEHVIAARQRLQALGAPHTAVPHLGFGGVLGGVVDGALSGGVGGGTGGGFFPSTGINNISVYNPIPGIMGLPNLHNPFGGGGGSGGGVIGAITPQNSFQAQTPDITTTNWSPGMALGQDTFKQGVGDAQNAVGSLNGIGAKQVWSGNQITNDAVDTRKLAGPAGLGGVLGQQQSLAGALADQAAGRGPNPAQDQFQQNVNQAIAQNAGMVASQKGLNPALAARMAGENAASMQQNAASNAAQLQAQQQLAAQGQLGNVLSQQGQTVMGQGQLYNSAGNLFGTQAGIYGGAGQSYGTAGSLGNALAGQGGSFYGTNVQGLGNQNNAVNTGSLGSQGINAGVANTNTLAKQGVTGGLLNAGGGILGGLIQNKAYGGVVNNYAGGGQVPDESATVLSRILANADSPPVMPGNGATGGQGMGILGNALGGWLGGLGAAGSLGSADAATGYLPQAGGNILPEAGAGGVGDILTTGATAVAANGGVIPDRKALSLAQALMARGGPVPGHAKVAGNSLKNDVVPAVLSPGEVVLPRSVTQAPDAAAKAAEFVEHLKTKAHPGYGQVLQARRKLAEAHQAFAQGGYCA